MRPISILRLAIAGLVLLIVVAERPAHAVTKSVKLIYESDAAGCVTAFEISPDTVQINSWAHKFTGRRKVVWTPVPKSSSGQVSGVSWKIVEKSSDGATCTGLISPVGNGYKCRPDLDLHRWTADWTYGVVASKDDCQDVKVDPAIIFRGGGGVEFLLLLLLGLAGGGAVIYWRRHHSG